MPGHRGGCGCPAGIGGSVVTVTPTSGDHFPGCHPEDDRAPDPPKGHKLQETENCWHCGTPTSQGCACADCLDADDYVAAGAMYHCETCGRWWAYMTVTEIKFGEIGTEASDA